MVLEAARQKPHAVPYLNRNAKNIGYVFFFEIQRPTQVENSITIINWNVNSIFLKISFKL